MRGVSFKKTIARFGVLCMGLLVMTACRGGSDHPQDMILARVGDRKITVEEYRERAELTVRPTYCNGRSRSEKEIILSSLIGEKLLALEAEKDTVLTGNKSFQYYLRGITEQAMRTRLLEMEVEEKISLSEEQIRRAMEMAGKQYKVAYLFSRSKDEIDRWSESVKQTRDFRQVAEDIYGKSRFPLKEVHWGEYEEPLESAIFDDSVTVGSVVGPVETSVGYYLVKILDFKETLMIGQGSTNTLFSKVENKLRMKQWRIDAANYVADLMQDKKIELDPLGFQILVEIYKPLYSKPDSLDKVPGEERGDDELRRNLIHRWQENMDLPLLRVNGKPWTLAEFSEYVRIRPLMFRDKNLKASEFAGYLKLAIKDILRDKYLTEVAYEKGLDEDGHVREVRLQWRDHLLAIGKRNKLLKDLGFTGDVSRNTPEALRVLQPELQRIAEDYDVKKFGEKLPEIELTGIPWMAIQTGMPYPQRVPPFPVVTANASPEYLSSAARIDTEKDNQLNHVEASN